MITCLPASVTHRVDANQHQGPLFDEFVVPVVGIVTLDEEDLVGKEKQHYNTQRRGHSDECLLYLRRFCTQTWGDEIGSEGGGGELRSIVSLSGAVVPDKRGSRLLSARNIKKKHSLFEVLAILTLGRSPVSFILGQKIVISSTRSNTCRLT